MKINPTSSYGRIQAGRPASASRPAAREASAEINADQVSFGAGKEIGRMVQSALRETVQPEPAGRVDSLRAAVNGGTYFVPAGQLADAILDRAFGGM